LVLNACQTGNDTAEADKKDSATALRTILLASDISCGQNADCESTVCASGQCVALGDATHAWMEMRISDAAMAVLESHPKQADQLFNTLLPELLAGDEYVQARVIGFLGRIPKKQSVPSLLPMLTSDVELVRVRARLALANLQHPPSFMPTLELLNHTSEAVVLNAIGAIAAYGKHKIHGDKATTQLAGLLNHENHRIQHRAITVLRNLALPRSKILAALTELLKREGDAALHYDAFEALVSLAPGRFDAASSDLKKNKL